MRTPTLAVAALTVFIAAGCGSKPHYQNHWVPLAQQTLPADPNGEQIIFANHYHGTIDQIKLIVQGGPIEIPYMRLVFDDGSTFWTPPHPPQRGDEWTLVFNLRSYERLIRRFELHVKRAGPAQSPATVRIIGR
jgi:hypothetical protein